MDANRLAQQLDRRMEALDRREAHRSNRKPLQECDRIFYRESIHYEDAEVSVIVMDNREYLRGNYKGIEIDQRGPWLLFKVVSVISGDPSGKITPGAVVLAKWDWGYKVYKRFLYDSDPKPGDKELLAIMAFIKVSEDELITGKV